MHDRLGESYCYWLPASIARAILRNGDVPSKAAQDYALIFPAIRANMTWRTTSLRYRSYDSSVPPANRRPHLRRSRRHWLGALHRDGVGIILRRYGSKAGNTEWWYPRYLGPPKDSNGGRIMLLADRAGVLRTSNREEAGDMKSGHDKGRVRQCGVKMCSQWAAFSGDLGCNL